MINFLATSLIFAMFLCFQRRVSGTAVFEAQGLATVITVIFAGIICAMSALLQVFSGEIASVVIVILAIIIYAWVGRIQSPKLSLNRNIFFVAFIVLFLIWRLFPAISLGSMVPFEGTGNHDELWYVFTARWLKENSLLTTFISDVRYPAISAVATNLGILPRLGSESLLVFFSSLTGYSIERVFQPIFALSSALICFLIYTGMKSACRDIYSSAIALIGIAVLPVGLFIYGNNNYATLIGLVLVMAWNWTFISALDRPGNISFALIPGLCFGALIATYPEILVLIGVAAPITIALKIFERPRPSIRKVVLTTFIAFISGFIFAPFAAWDAIRVLLTTTSAINNPTHMYAEFFSQNSFSALILLFTTMDSTIPYLKLGIIGSSIYAAAILIHYFYVTMQILRGIIGLLIGSLIVLVICWGKNYGYGGMKAVEILFPPLGVVSAAALALAADRIRCFFCQPSFRSFNFSFIILVGAVLLTFCGFLLVTYSRTVSFYHVAIEKHLLEDVISLEKAKDVIPPDGILYVDSNLGSHPFLTSRWIAYTLRNTPLVFSMSLSEGGYLYSLGENFNQRLAKVTHILRGRTLGSPVTEGAIYSNSTFEIVPIGVMPYSFGSGFYADEGWGRWMSAVGIVQIVSSCNRDISIHFARRFQGLVGENAILVKTATSQMKFNLDKTGNTIKFPISDKDSQIQLTSISEAKSPQDIGLSADTRKLSYGVSGIDFGPCFSTANK